MKLLIEKCTRSPLIAIAMAIATALLWLTPAVAQQTTGSITGTVSDEGVKRTV